MSILAMYNMKGGVGKTSSIVNLAYLSALGGEKTLLCDLDPQSPSCYYFRIKPKMKRGAKGLVHPSRKILENIKGTDFENLDLLPSDFRFRNLDLKLNLHRHSKAGLKEAFKSLQREYKKILLDCPPNLTLISENIFNLADYILVPIIPSTLSVRTLEQILCFIKKKRYDPSKVHIFFSMIDRRKKRFCIQIRL